MLHADSHYLKILHLHLSPLQLFMLLVSNAAGGVLFIESGMLFHKRLPRNLIEAMRSLVLFVAGICIK